jgi:SAM-dependent methyltransferase
MNKTMHCPLCDGPEIGPFYAGSRRVYLRCRDCALVFVPPQYYLERDAERAEYDLHENEVGEPGYQGFLARLAGPLTARLPRGASGLDFGCGPAPALADMLTRAGFSMRLYDSFYYPDTAPLAGSYDFICATEVVEHLHRPGAELARLWSLLRPGGWLGVMTKLVRDRDAFANWHYKNDPTHVVFFSVQTWQWWAARHGAELELLGADVMLLQRRRVERGGA